MASVLALSDQMGDLEFACLGSIWIFFYSDPDLGSGFDFGLIFGFGMILRKRSWVISSLIYKVPQDCMIVSD